MELAQARQEGKAARTQRTSPSSGKVKGQECPVGVQGMVGNTRHKCMWQCQALLGLPFPPRHPLCLVLLLLLPFDQLMLLMANTRSLPYHANLYSLLSFAFCYNFPSFICLQCFLFFFLFDFFSFFTPLSFKYQMRTHQPTDVVNLLF